MNVLVIARVNVVRMLRDRTSLFFVFLLPVVLIMVLGTAYGGRVAPRLGMVATECGALGAELVAAIRAAACSWSSRCRRRSRTCGRGWRRGAWSSG